MAKYLLQVAKIVGLSSETSWSQVHDFTPQDQQKLVKRGRLICAVGFRKLQAEIGSADAGKEIISRIHEEYYGSLEENSLIQLRRSVEKVAQEALGEAEIQIAALAIVGNAAYVSVFGGAKFLIFRDQQFGVIVDGSEAPEAASGYLLDGDVFLLGSADFFKVVPLGIIKANIGQKSIDEMAEFFALTVHGHVDNQAAAAVVGRFSQVEEEEIYQEAEIISPSVKQGPVIIEKPKSNRLLWVRIFFNSFFGKINRAMLQAEIKLEKLLKLGRKRPSENFNERGIGPVKGRIRLSAKTILTVIVTLVLIAIIAGSFSIIHGIRGEKAGPTLSISLVMSKLGEAEGFLDSDSARTKSLISESEALIAQIKASGVPDWKLGGAEAKLKELINLMTKEKTAEGTIFYDVTLIQANAQIADWELAGERIYMLDKVNGAVYLLSFLNSGKKGEIVFGGDELKNATRMAINGDSVLIVGEGRTIIYNLVSKKKEILIDEKLIIASCLSLKGFSGNYYSLDTGGQLKKFGSTSDYQKASDWLKQKITGLVSMTIDGNIWLADGAQVMKFAQGYRELFSVKGLLKPFSKISAIYTSAGEKNVYVLDAGNNRVVALRKNGDYIRDYNWSELGKADSFLVSEKAGKIFLLFKDKIFEIRL